MMKQNRKYGTGLRMSVRKVAVAMAGMAIAVVLGAVPAMAELTTVDLTKTDGGITLTLDHTDEKTKETYLMDGGTVSVYTVATVTEDGGGYRYDLSGGSFGSIEDEVVKKIPEYSQEELENQNKALSEKLAEYAGDVSADKVKRSPISNGTAAVSNLVPGLYLVVNTEKDKKEYTFSPFLMSLPDSEGNYRITADPKTSIILPENPPESSSNPPESSSNPPESSSNPPESSSNPPESSSNPPESSSNPPESSTTPPPGGGNPPGGGGGNPPRRNPPSTTGVQTPPPTDSGVLGAVRDNGERVLGALRNPGQVLGAVRTGDPSAIFICGEILVLASLMLIGWISVFKKLRRRA